MESSVKEGRMRQQNAPANVDLILGRPRRRSRLASRRPPATLPTLLLVLLSVFTTPAVNAAFITFDNCLNPNILNSSPKQLQFVPLFVNAVFNPTDKKHTLNITVYGNVTGQAQDGPYPPRTALDFKNDTKGLFSIVDAPDNYTTLFTNIDVLSYEAYNAAPARFCNTTLGGGCPWIPLWDANASNPQELHAFSIAHSFYSAYSFATFAASLTVDSGSSKALACIAANITPDLGRALSDAIRYIPAAILALVGLATIMAARFSPWSSKNIFYWTSNYGRDDDILRLVTPGFGDCLQYIQFIVLAGSLSLGYPGFYQPVVSQASWSVLVFNESMVSHGNGTQSLVDGIYTTNSSYGLTRLSQLAGMSRDDDLWAGMAVWVLVIMASCLILCQLGFAAQFLVRLYTKVPQEDLRNKNLPFTAGNFVRIVFNYFMLPIVALSMFQLVIAAHSPAYIVALAATLLCALIAFAAWIFRLIFTTKPRVHLFDDEPLLLIYGPLYNTYSDEAAPYAFIPFLLTFIRGIAVGAVQPSGIAQLVILAICEVVLILTLHAFRPFRSLTSMNAYHTFFSVIRLVTTLLSVAFVPSLQVSETSKGWIGYAILLLHAVVLIFGFFLNSIQTLIEVFARLAGAGRETRGGLTTVFGMRQLSKRARRDRVRGSMISEATALTGAKSMHGRSRSRSMSASSNMLLNKSPDQRGSANFDQLSQGEGSIMTGGTSPGPSTPGGPQSPFSFIPGANLGNQAGIKAAPVNKVIEPADPYYRPPRLRRPTLDALQDPPQAMEEQIRRRLSQPLAATNIGEGPSAFSPNRGSITAGFMRNFRDDAESQSGNSPRQHTDYSTRESDFYYGVRGPALSKTHGSRRLKTGPADPMSPIGSATGWFKGLFGGKTTSKKGGFEVVRSTPLHQLQEQDEEVPRGNAEPYRNIPVLDGATEVVSSQEYSKASTSLESFHPSIRASTTHMQQLSNVPPMIAPMTSASSVHVSNRSTSKSSSARYMPANLHRDSSGDIPTIAPIQGKKPGLDRVSSFRGPGNKDPEARVPFSSTQTASQTDHSTRGSLSSSIYPASEEALDLGESHPEPNDKTVSGTMTVYSSDPYEYPAPAFNLGNELERPLSTGRVAQHKAGEGIHHRVYDVDSHVLQGSAAELVDPNEGRRGNKGSDSRLSP
ncbi:hypothetical protein FKW77_010377 [Venturia effusa]|uniref:ML-like domain-containing protein n=1 Tax=Venturia effusa TaxID=50376 RepID=A0A517L4H0_9PEZI|nr:hypothetical protein FKW77_010377 [Venturia effusa]